MTANLHGTYNLIPTPWNPKHPSNHYNDSEDCDVKFVRDILEKNPPLLTWMFTMPFMYTSNI